MDEVNDRVAIVNDKNILKRVLNFFLAKIVVGIAVVGGAVVLMQFAANFLQERSSLPFELINISNAILTIVIALYAYRKFFKFYETGQIPELATNKFGRDFGLGLMIGFGLQSIFILALYLNGDYSIYHINEWTAIVPGLMDALVAGVISEILLRGVILRFLEQGLGTVAAIVIVAIMFAIAQVSVNGNHWLSVMAIAMQAGALFSAAFIFTRTLWLPIFMHFAWDFAEPSVYGGINPGISLKESLFVSKISGPEFLSGGKFGPGYSLPSIIFCFIIAILFLILAKRKNNFIKSSWIKITFNKNVTH